MIESKGLQFLKPTRQMREMRLLLAVSEVGGGTSQQSLGERAGMSAGMTNQYLHRLVSQGWVRVCGETNRTMAYHLTESGRRALINELIEFSSEIVQLYGAAKHEFEARLRECHAQGLKKLVLFGAAETGEVVYRAAQRTPIEIVAVVDNDPAKHGERFGDIQVAPPSVLQSMVFDGILITSHGHQDAIYQELRTLRASGIKIKRI